MRDGKINGWLIKTDGIVKSLSSLRHLYLRNNSKNTSHITFDKNYTDIKRSNRVPNWQFNRVIYK